MTETPMGVKMIIVWISGSLGSLFGPLSKDDTRQRIACKRLPLQRGVDAFRGLSPMSEFRSD